MRLTLELISEAPQLLNPNKEWTIVIRGCKIPMIENLGATGDHFECIDMTDNEIIKISNFPTLHRLQTLIMCNNRISRIDPHIMKCLPNLTSLILTNNKLETFSDLLPIFESKTLERLSLVENPVSYDERYRFLCIYKLTTLRFLDFKRVTENDRIKAKQMFDGAEGSKLFLQIAPSRQEVKEIEKELGEKNLPNAEQIEKIKLAISKATTLDEISRLEAALKAGVIPVMQEDSENSIHARNNSDEKGDEPMEES